MKGLQLSLFNENQIMIPSSEQLTLKQASEWASTYIGKKVTISNISYLIQYGRIKKYGNNGNIYVSIYELKNYYNSYKGKRELLWKEQLGEDLNWALSFDQYKEAETTKHVHRLHPYKGKFIPQLVEYFLDSHTDNFKKEVYFKKGDIILDPFCGSGTTLVQANELGIHAIGVDISEFNTLISNCKINKYNLLEVKKEIDRITRKLRLHISNSHILEFDEELTNILSNFNNENFPVPEYKYRLRKGEIEEEQYSKEKEKSFLNIYNNLIRKYNIKLRQHKSEKFIDIWYIQPVRNEIELVKDEIEQIKDSLTKDIVRIILSRTMRSCRATTHSDLATLKEPIITPYYCTKHGKICKPLFSILKWWQTYSDDTIKRLGQFNNLRTNTYQICLKGDSRTIDLLKGIETQLPNFANLIRAQKIKGIFSSPPYVGSVSYT
ncbi:MAG: site-specific DNA-methyltransferase, partial [Chitinispirillaceae bacterium]|nr:site-specific DNA-methyltransferase [Chitinispirillaceae bacterium]